LSSSDDIIVCEAVFEDERILQRMGNSYGVTLPSWLIKMHRLLTMPIKSGIVLRDKHGEERWYLIDLKSEKPKPKQLIINFRKDNNNQRVRAYITI